MNRQPKVKTKYFGIKLEPKLHREVAERARATGISVSQWIRGAMIMKLRVDGSDSITLNGAATITVHAHVKPNGRKRKSHA